MSTSGSLLYCSKFHLLRKNFNTFEWVASTLGTAHFFAWLDQSSHRQPQGWFESALDTSVQVDGREWRAAGNQNDFRVTVAVVGWWVRCGAGRLRWYSSNCEVVTCARVHENKVSLLAEVGSMHTPGSK